MDTQPPANIASFIIRFVHHGPSGQSETGAEGSTFYRGTVRHIQSDQELAFACWEDAVDFMRRFVPFEIERRSSCD